MQKLPTTPGKLSAAPGRPATTGSRERRDVVMDLTEPISILFLKIIAFILQIKYNSLNSDPNDKH